MADTDPSLSPEKKLLDIIEGSGSNAAPGGSEDVPPSRPAILDFQKFADPAFWLSSLKGLADNLIGVFKGQQAGLTIKRIISIFRGAIVILGVVLGLNLVYEFYVTNLPLKKKPGAAMRTVAEASEAMSPIYTSNIAMDQNRRNVFAPIVRKDVATEGRSDIALKLVEMTKQLKLTGISMHPEDPNRTFCMIEDLQKNITAFLKIGDSISGLTVSKITPESVTLKYETEEVEIR